MSGGPPPALAEAASLPSDQIALELDLHPADAPMFWRAPPFAPLRQGARVRTAPLIVVWHDGPRGELAAAGFWLSEHRLGARVAWRVERSQRDGASGWQAATASPVLLEAKSPDALGLDLPEPLAPIARFDGLSRSAPLPAGSGLHAARLQVGTLHAHQADCVACRVVLEGSSRETFALAYALAGSMRLHLARAPLPGLLVEGTPAPAAPVVPEGASVSMALASLIGQLSQALLHWAPLVAAGPDPEPVHQMRVALRRLRSALKLFAAAAACPALETAEGGLRALGRALAPARDWDVFIGGLGSTVHAAVPDERAVARLLAEARRCRDASYQGLAVELAGAPFRRLGLTLAELAAARPWESVEAHAPHCTVSARQAELLATDLSTYARQALHRRLRRVHAAGHDLADLPTEELHALRLHCKRLRYAAEFFAPLFPGRQVRRFIRRLAAVQERLGRVNDGAVAGGLMQSLGGGAGRAFAAGLVRGYVAAHGQRARDKAARSWRRFRRCEAFWN